MSNQAARIPNDRDERLEPITAPPAEPSAVGAAERAVEAAQRIVVERLELMRLELVDGFSEVLKRAGAVMAAGFVAILGWTGLAIALAVVLSDYMHPAASIAFVGALHLLIGLMLAIWAGTSGRERKQ